jgi:putative hemolysin
MIEHIIIILVSIIFSAFFSGMEIAYITSNRLYFELEKKQGSWSSSIISKLNKRPSKFITTMLIGNNIALVVYGIFMGDLIIEFIFPEYINNTLYPFWVLFVQTVLSTLIILVTAEFMPKALFRIYSNEFLSAFSVPAYIVYQLFYLVSEFVVWLSKMFLKILTGKNFTDKEGEFKKVDLGNYISEQLESVDDKRDMDVEIQMFQNALEFSDVKARECMIPRTDIISIDIKDNIENLNNLFVATGKSKIVVYKEDIDDIVGYVHSFEMFKKPKDIMSILLPVEFVPETLSVNDIMNSLMKKRKSIAIVLDEYGGTSGLITIEDIVEELFGEIEDEHDTTEVIEKRISDNEFIFSSRIEIDYLNENYELNIDVSEEYETLGGFVLHHLEKIPEKNQVLRLKGIEIIVNKVSNNRIEELTLKIV